MEVLPVPHRITDSNGRQWAAYTLDEAKRLLEIDAEVVSLRGRVERYEELKRLYLEQLGALKAQCELQNKQIVMIGERLQEKTSYIEDLIEEKNKYKYQRKWALFGAKTSFLTVAVIGLGIAVAVK